VEEDSLNLTIGEDEEQLLGEETEEKKPEVANADTSDKVDAEKGEGDKAGDEAAKESDEKTENVENG
jgi:hypothetical protein